MKCPKCERDGLIYGAFSQANRLRAVCLSCYLYWEIDGKKITLKNLKLDDKRD